MTNISQRPMHHYTECGLDNIYLMNGFTVSKEDGEEYFSFEDADGLHLAIARALVRKHDALSGREFRFIRKQLDMSQRAMAKLLGFEEQAVARWEKEAEVQKAVDLVIRTLFVERDQGNAFLGSLIERMNEGERSHHAENITLKRKENIWTLRQQDAA